MPEENSKGLIDFFRRGERLPWLGLWFEVSTVKDVSLVLRASDQSIDLQERIKRGTKHRWKRIDFEVMTVLSHAVVLIGRGLTERAGRIVKSTERKRKKHRGQQKKAAA